MKETKASLSNRMFDTLVSAIALILLLPVLLICCILVFATSKGPIFFKAVRVGKRQKPFTMYKFRTMHHSYPQAGDITAHKDGRITTIGKFLRSTKIDELPQLANIFLGDMSIVGPRPEATKIVEKYYTPEMKRVLDYTPGLTSPGTLFNEERKHLLRESNSEAFYAEHILPERVALDISYFEDRSFRKDIGLVIQTLFKLCRT
jgi:lipopolysaccharide/colanic/teichoic acid biosynthesis glycosyltransferase